MRASRNSDRPDTSKPIEEAVSGGNCLFICARIEPILERNRFITGSRHGAAGQGEGSNMHGPKRSPQRGPQRSPQRGPQRGPKRGLVASALVGLGALLALGAAQAQSTDGRSRPGSPPVTVPLKDGSGNPARRVPGSRRQIRLSFAPIVKRAAPAVVNIRTIKGLQGAYRGRFNRPFYGRRRRGSLGSGVIVRANGLIVTNYHVIRQATQIKVILADKREFLARILLKDQRTDLAILKIDAGSEKLPIIRLHDSDDVLVGDLVLAIGNPFGVGQTVTSGIVSALARTRVGITDYRFFIQTDAAINPGNSGGALIAMNGRLVGINTAIYSRGGGSIGIGFAVPSNMVQRVIATAAKGGTKVLRPWLGVSVQPITASLAKALGMKKPNGVIVLRVVAGSPAFKAGLRPRDVIVLLNKRQIFDAQGLKFRLGTLEVGGLATLSILRRDRSREISFQLISRPSRAGNARLIRGRNPLSGARVSDLSSGLADDLGLAGRRGVVVVAIRRGSIAHRLGVRRRDIVLRLNGQAVRRVTDVFSVLRAQPPNQRRWQIVIRRGNRVIRRSLNLWR